MHIESKDRVSIHTIEIRSCASHCGITAGALGYKQALFLELDKAK